MTRKTSALLAAAALGLALFASGPALGASDQAQVTVTILKPLSVTQFQDMDFGEIAPPSAAAQTFSMNPATGGVTEGAGDGAAFGTTQRAIFDVDGEGGKNVTVTATSTAFSGAGLALAPTTDWVGPALSGAVQQIGVGGTLTVGPGATAGVQTAQVTLTVLYE